MISILILILKIDLLNRSNNLEVNGSPSFFPNYLCCTVLPPNFYKWIITVVNTESKRLVIQKFKESDIGPWAEIEKDPFVRRYIDGKTLSYDQAAAYVHRNIDHYNDKGFSRYAVRYKSTDQLIGMCGFLEEDYGIDFGYRYIPAFWGMGIGLEAAKAVLQIGLPEPMPRTVFGIVALNNSGSIRILEKLDFHLLGRTRMHGLEALKYKYVIRNLDNQ